MFKFFDDLANQIFPKSSTPSPAPGGKPPPTEKAPAPRAKLPTEKPKRKPPTVKRYESKFDLGTALDLMNDEGQELSTRIAAAASVMKQPGANHDQRQAASKFLGRAGGLRKAENKKKLAENARIQDKQPASA